MNDLADAMSRVQAAAAILRGAYATRTPPAPPYNRFRELEFAA